MADVEDRDAAGEIHVAPSVRVPQLGVLRARGKDRHGGGQATRNRGLATLLQAGVVDHGGLLDWSQIATMWAKGVGPVFGGACCQKAPRHDRCALSSTAPEWSDPYDVHVREAPEVESPREFRAALYRCGQT